MELYIDNRETSIKKYFEDRYMDKIKCMNLDLGDFVFKYNNEVILIIERKTIEDLASSIKDGRYREQKSRLISNYPLHKILFIIEGDLTLENKSLKFNKVSKKTIYSSLINLLVRDNIHTWTSFSIKYTIEFLENMMIKLETQGDTFMNKSNNYIDNLCKNINKVKKTNLTPELVYRSQLLSIPGISNKYVDVIIENYPDMVKLINNLSELSYTDKLKTIENISYITDKQKKRKLGKKIAINLVNNIFFNYLK